MSNLPSSGLKNYENRHLSKNDDIRNDEISSGLRRFNQGLLFFYELLGLFCDTKSENGNHFTTETSDAQIVSNQDGTQGFKDPNDDFLHDFQNMDNMANTADANCNHECRQLKRLNEDAPNSSQTKRRRGRPYSSQQEPPDIQTDEERKRWNWNRSQKRKTVKRNRERDIQEYEIKKQTITKSIFRVLTSVHQELINQIVNYITSHPKEYNYKDVLNRVEKENCKMTYKAFTKKAKTLSLIGIKRDEINEGLFIEFDKILNEIDDFMGIN